jgi:hypothetical protein
VGGAGGGVHIATHNRRAGHRRCVRMHACRGKVVKRNKCMHCKIVGVSASHMCRYKNCY